MAVVILLLCVGNVDSACPTASTKWSSWTKAPSSPNQVLVIEKGESILLDVSPVAINSITIKGKLVFDSTKASLTLKAGLVFVDGGELWVGSEDCPYTASAEFVLTGQAPSQPLPSNKAISVTNGGVLNLHGLPTTSWTNLTVSANKGDNSILVNEPMKGWAVGKTIFIAPTAFFIEEIEVRTITAINGNNVTLNASLEFYHHSDFYHGVNGERVEMRAEIALLERNVVVRGDDDSEATQFGATTMCYIKALCKFSNVLFRETGHELVRGRYTVHFHDLGDVHGGWAKGNVVYNSFNRAYVIHSTNHTTLEDNVSIKVKGHAYFIEDGNEFYNDLIGNLALNTITMKDDLTAGDKDQVSAYWITNPVNTLVGNRAVGAVFGFWYAMPYHPIGLGVTKYNLTDMWPMYIPVLKFEDNVAHTIKGDGLFVDRGVRDDNTAPSGTFYRPSRFAYITSLDYKGDRIGGDAEPGISYFTRYLAYKCNGMGAWMRGYNMEFHYSAFIDNGVGLEFAGGNNRVVHGFVVGLSDNWGTNRPFGFVDFTTYGSSWYNAVGFNFYHGGGPTHVVHTTFQNFADVLLDGLDYFGNERRRRGWAIHTDTGGTAYPSHDRFYNITFFNVSHNVWFNTDHQAMADKSQCELSPLLIDIDGSLSGKCGSWLTSSFNPLMVTPACVKNDVINGYVCPPTHTPIRMFEVIEGGGSGGIVTRLHDKASIALSQGDWSIHLVANADYFLKFGKGTQLQSDSPGTLAIQMPLMQVGEYVNLVIPYKPGSTVNKVYGTDAKIEFTPTNSRDSLNGFNYYWDSSAGLMYIRYITPADTFQYQQDTVFSLNSWSSYGGYKWVVKIEMNCNGGCTHTVDPAGVSGTYKAKEGKFKTCGDLLAGGLPKWSGDSSVAPYVIFDGEMRNNWTATGSASIVPNNITVAPLVNTKLLHGGPPFYLQPTSTLDVSKYTHLALDILLDGSVGDRTRACIVMNSQNKTTQRALLGTDTDLCNPFYTPFPPFDKWEWRTVYVPLADLRKPFDPATIDKLEITTGGQFPYRPTQWYLANIRLLKGTNAIQSMGNDIWLGGRGGDPDPMPWATPLVNANTIKVGNRTYSQSPTYRLGPSTPGCFWPAMLSGKCTPPVVTYPTAPPTTPASTGSVPSSSTTSKLPDQDDAANSLSLFWPLLLSVVLFAVHFVN